MSIKNKNQTKDLSVGDKVPCLKELISEDQQHIIDQYQGMNIVLYFYPKDNTPGCTKQATEFTLHHAAFEKLNTAVIGVSRDSLNSHEKFKNKHDLSIALISDPDEKLCQAFGVIREKNSYGRIVIGIQRSTFLIDADGIIQQAWRNIKVPNHVQKVLDALRP